MPCSYVLWYRGLKGTMILCCGWMLEWIFHGHFIFHSWWDGHVFIRNRLWKHLPRHFGSEDAALQYINDWWLMISSTYSSYDFYFYFFANLFLSFPLSFIFRVVEYSLDLQNINLTAIRTVRVLRPLKAINRVPSKWWLSRLISTFLSFDSEKTKFCSFPPPFPPSQNCAVWSNIYLHWQQKYTRVYTLGMYFISILNRNMDFLRLF